MKKIKKASKIQSMDSGTKVIAAFSSFIIFFKPIHQMYLIYKWTLTI